MGSSSGSASPESAARPGFVKLLPEHRGVLDDAPLLRREAVEAGGDERVQRLGHLERLDRAGRAVDVAVAREQAAVEEHPHRLDRVERHALRALEDPRAQVVGEPGHEAVEQLLHRGAAQRLERERRRVAAAGAEARAALGELGPREREHEERVRVRPLEQVLDEVEQRRVGPLQVLEHEHDRALLGEPLEEEPPGGEEVLPVAAPRAPRARADGRGAARATRARSASSTRCSSIARELSRAPPPACPLRRSAPRIRTISASAQ